MTPWKRTWRSGCRIISRSAPATPGATALDEQSDIGLFFTGDNPKHLRDSWASSDFDRTHVFTANFQVDVPNAVKEHNFASYFTNDWHLTGMGPCKAASRILCTSSMARWAASTSETSRR